MSYSDTPYTIQLWDARAGKIRYALKGQKSPASTLSFSLNGKTLMSSEDGNWSTNTEGNMIRLWDTATGRLTRTVKLPVKDVSWVAFSPSGQSAVTLSTSGKENAYVGDVKQWSLQTGHLMRTIKRLPETREIALSADWKTLAATGTHAITIWDTVTGSKKRTFKRDIQNVQPQSLVFSPDGTLLANADTGSYLTDAWDKSYGLYGNITLWNIKTGKSVNLAVNPNSSLSPGQVSGSGMTRRNDQGPLLLFSPDSRTLVAGGGGGDSGGSLWLWDISKLRAQL